LLHCREDALRAAGFSDIFLAIKQQENATALALLPDVCADLDQHTEQVSCEAARDTLQTELLKMFCVFKSTCFI
jgi:hypothetical protein